MRRRTVRGERAYPSLVCKGHYLVFLGVMSCTQDGVDSDSSRFSLSGALHAL